MTHQNSKVVMVRIYWDVVIAICGMVTQEVIYVEDNKSGERLKIHAVQCVRYNSRGPDSLQKWGMKSTLRTKQ